MDRYRLRCIDRDGTRHDVRWMQGAGVAGERILQARREGDEVLTTNQDYGRMLNTWMQRERREGIKLRQISFPVPPPSQDDLETDGAPF